MWYSLKLKTINKFLFICLAFIGSSCDILDGWMLSEIPNNHNFKKTLSSYNLFDGDLSELKPAEGVVQFELTTPLFTDYASKQRLFLIPKNTSIKVDDNGSFSYPDSSLIAKTFYYPQNDNKYHIIETRLLYFIDGRWNVAVYEWNRDQTEAFLIKDGTKREVEWNTSSGEIKSTRYRIPSLAECTTCHQKSDQVIPIGPKLANMDHEITLNNATVNQLDYLKSKNTISNFDRTNIDAFPKWNDPRHSLKKRARAYIDVNCAHCHSPSGFADYSSLYLNYSLPLSKTGIQSRKDRIKNRINSRWRGEKMPLIGTTMIHDEGVELIQEYLNDL